ncbi:MAG: hypothetical protein V4696_00765 [Pseudomonadota bacterium]
MTRYAATVRDQYQRPIPGAQIYVYDTTGALVDLTDDLGAPLVNPVLSDDFGGFYFNVPNGEYSLTYVFEGRTVFREEVLIDPAPATSATAAAASAAAAAASAAMVLVGKVATFAISSLPAPDVPRIVFVTDAANTAGSGAGTLAYSDGSQWLDLSGATLTPATLVQRLPYGATAMWLVDAYSAAPSPHIPNAIATEAVSPNLMRYPRRSFAAAKGFYFHATATAVDGGVSDPYGGTEASTLVGTGNWKMIPNNPAGSFPAGEYTLCVNAKRNTGSDQAFAFTMDNGATRSAVKTATSAWQRFTYTFTLGAPVGAVNFGLVSSDGVAGADLQIIDFEIFAGAVDLGLGANNAAGHAYFGDSAYQTQTYAAGVKTNGYASVNLPLSIANTAFTFSALVNVTTAGGFNGMLSELNSYGPLTLHSVIASQGFTDVTASGFAFRNDILADTSIGSGAFSNIVFTPVVDGKYRQFTYTYSAGVLELWVNDVRMYRWEKTLSAYSFYNLWLNTINAANPAAHTLAGFTALWPRKLTNAEVRNAFTLNKERAAVSSVTVDSDTTDRILAIEGDSISEGAITYPGIYAGSFDSPSIWGSTWASSGSTIANLNQRAAAVDGVLPLNKNGRKFILSLLIGANDLAGYASAAQYITDLRAYCMARATAGWIVSLGTILPLDGDATHNSRRATVNADIIANPTLYGMTSGAAIFNFAGDAIMGPDNSRSVNPSHWTDGTHPNATGQAVLETIYRPVINAL